MKYKCGRCNRFVEKLVEIGDAYQSAYDSAMYSGLLEVAYPSIYTEHVCISCVKDILNITDEDIIREERLLNIQTDFQINLLKGRLAQVVIEIIFQDFGYEVYPYGYESYLTNIIKFLKKGNTNIPARKVRSTPDLFIYDREFNEGFFIEVKATNTPDETKFWISKWVLDGYMEYWKEAVLVIYCIPSMRIYCKQVQDIELEQILVEESPITENTNYVINLESEFDTLPNYFRLVEPSRYSDLCQKIHEVLQLYK